MVLFDTHCHIEDKSYDKCRDEIVERMEKVGVECATVVGINLARSKKCIQVAEKYENIFASVGIHPHNANEATPKALKELKKIASHEKVCAWGELGLDFNRLFQPVDVQVNCMVEQLKIADALGLPSIFHERDTKGKFLEVLQTHTNSQRRGVVHCFGGNRKELLAYLDMGLYIGVTGIVTHPQRGASLRSLINLIPSDKLVIETDSPYLTPFQHKKSRRNEPSFVGAVLQTLAEVRGVSEEVLAEQLWNNSCALFGIE